MEPSSASRAPSCSITNVNNTIKTAVKRSLEDENASIVIKKKKVKCEIRFIYIHTINHYNINVNGLYFN